MLSKKVILLGKYGVGKTSLIRQYVYQKFSEQYLTTIGVKIDKKEVQVQEKSVNLLIWDIAGEDSQTKVPPTYKLGAHAVVYVFDLTRPATYESITKELKQISLELPAIPVWLVGNKSDLLRNNEIDEIIAKVSTKVHFTTSAKTADQVEDLFFKVAKHFV